MAVGASGTILSSTDAKNWTIRQSGIYGSFLRTVTYGKDRFLAGENLDTLFSSPDGISWSPLVTGTQQSIDCMIFDGKQFVAAGYPGRIATSPDGKSWTVKSIPNVYTLNSVAYLNHRYIALGDIIATSPDASDWSVVTKHLDLSLSSVAYGNGLYVAVGNSGAVMTSSDALTWTDKTLSIPFWFSQVLFTGTEFLAVTSSGNVLTSTDGTQWTTNKSPTTNGLNAIVQTEDQLVTAGWEGTLLVTKHDYPAPVSSRIDRFHNNFLVRLDRQFLTVTLDKDSWASGGNRVELFNTSGQRVYSSQVGATSGPIRLSVHDLPRGRYFVRVGPHGANVVKL